MKKLIIAAALVAAVPAQATLIVSGDGNIVTLLTDAFAPHDVNNQQFFTNLLNGTSKVVIRSISGPSIDATYLTGFYGGIGVSTTLFDYNSAITAASLATTSVFIDLVPYQYYTAGEVTAISDFLHSGGNFLVSGDNQYFSPDSNLYINGLLGSLGSSIHIEDDCFPCGYFDAATTVGAGPLVAGVPYIQVAAASKLTGGAALFSYAGKTVVAIEEFSVTPPGVPEPASWAMLIAGFGLTGAAMRRRRLAVAA